MWNHNTWPLQGNGFLTTLPQQAIHMTTAMVTHTAIEELLAEIFW
jgi:hypothetical protein